MNRPRIWADANGVSHWEDVELDMIEQEYVPGFPSMLTQPVDARRVQFICWPPGTVQAWHQSPRRHLCITLAGEFEVETSDGEVRRFRPGGVYLGEDLSGPGHESRSVGDQDWVGMVVSLED
jgi:hypothetical protein